MAKGATKWIYFGRTMGNSTHFILTLILIKNQGLAGVALAFTLFTLIHGTMAIGIARKLSDFSLAPAALRLIISAVAIIITAFIVNQYTSQLLKIILGAVITGAACLISLRGISSRLGAHHRIVRIALKFPGGRFASGI